MKSFKNYVLRRETNDFGGGPDGITQAWEMAVKNHRREVETFLRGLGDPEINKILDKDSGHALDPVERDEIKPPEADGGASEDQDGLGR